MDQTKSNASKLKWQIYGFHAREHWADNRWLTFLKSTVATLVGRFSSTGRAFRWTCATGTRWAHHSCSIRWIILGGWTSIGRTGVLCAKRRSFDVRIISSVKILLGWTILIGSRLDSNRAYRGEAVRVFTVTIVLHFLRLYLEQQHLPHVWQQRTGETHQ